MAACRKPGGQCRRRAVAHWLSQWAESSCAATPEGGCPVCERTWTLIEERRRHRRLQVPLSAYVAWEAGHTRVTAPRGDISRTGVFLRLDSPVAIGTVVRVELANPTDDSTTSISGQVIHTVRNGRAGKPSFGVGIEFLEVGEELRQFVEGLEVAPENIGVKDT